MEIKTLKRTVRMIFWGLHVAFPSFLQAQSLPYKALLYLTYDKEFPLAYHEQRSLLENALLLDTREREEYQVSHIQGAKWVGYETFDMEKLSELPKDQPIIVYCSIGARSQEIGRLLQKEGFEEVYNLYGGIFHWVNEGLPLFDPDSQPTHRIHTYDRKWGRWVTRGEKVY